MGTLYGLYFAYVEKLVVIDRVAVVANASNLAFIVGHEIVFRSIMVEEVILLLEHLFGEGELH